MKPNPKNSQPSTEDDCGEFAIFDSLDALAAYLHHRYGEEALREVFEALQETREGLEDITAELEQRGLDAPAAVLRDLAHQAISGIELVPDYVVRAGPNFVDFWQMRWLQRRKMKLGLWDKEQRAKAQQTEH